MMFRMLHRLALCLIASMLSTSCSTTTPDTGFLDRSITIGSSTFPYVVYVPREWNASKKWPVVLFLHGSGERGVDGLRPTQVGLGAALRTMPDRLPAIVIFPQAPPGTQWIGAPAEAAMQALDRSIHEFSGDAHRVYLTGLSLGGYGVWHLALAHPDRFAALAPVCGGIVPAGSATSVRQSPLTIAAADPYAFTAERLRHLPTWIFHGADDTVVLPSESRKMHEVLRLQNAPVRYTEYEAVGHNAWDRAYAEPELWAWLFEQQRH
jgi:predicted peptidase